MDEIKKEHIRYASNYISGLTHMASSCSKYLGPSYVDANCFSKKDFKEEFAKFYNVNINEIKLVEINKSFREVLTGIFGEDVQRLIDGLEHWIHMEAGDPVKLYHIDDESNLAEQLSGCNRGRGAFYFMEDIFFFEFEKMVICFMIGNDE